MAPGISNKNVVAFFLVGILGLTSFVFINVAQPYILEQHLGVPRSKQGSLSGSLMFLQEVIVLALIGALGAIADKIGRRPVFSIGFVFVALGLFLYPLATAQNQLFFLRALVAVGAAAYASMLATVAADYPTDASRGKLIGALSFAQGTGVLLLVSLTLTKVPSWFQDAGYDAISTGRLWFWIVAMTALLAAVIAHFGLKRGRSESTETRRTGVATLVKEGLRQARRNPRLALAFSAGFAARGDIVVVGTFTSLWFLQAGLANGLNPAQAMARFGPVFAVVQASVIIWSPIAGFIIDRIDRVMGLAAAMGIAALAYWSTYFVDDPLGPRMLIVAAFLGIGESSTLVAGQALVGQEARAEIRGSVVGAFSFFAAMGILFSTSVGGYLFDLWRPAAPYIFIGTINAGVMIFALIVRNRVLKLQPKES
jgi:MFS family permease